MDPVPAEIARAVAKIGFSGSICVAAGDGTGWSAAYGLASRRFGILNRPDTPFGIASGTKGFTALTVMSLVEEGALSMSSTVRSVVGADLPLVDERVTVEQLLTIVPASVTISMRAQGYRPTTTSFRFPSTGSVARTRTSKFFRDTRWRSPPMSGSPIATADT